MMGFYEQRIFPRVMDYALSGHPIRETRKSVLEHAHGRVVEIGFGTGLNLPHYPEHISNIATIEINPGMHRLAERRAHKTGIRVEQVLVDNDQWPLEDESVDTLVSTFTLCSIAQLDQVLAEIKRVLKPGGRMVFAEHGLSHEPHIQKWQHRLNPVQNVVGCGCHLNRNIGEILQGADFSDLSLDTFYMKTMPKLMGYMYQGVAIK